MDRVGGLDVYNDEVVRWSSLPPLPPPQLFSFIACSRCLHEKHGRMARARTRRMEKKKKKGTTTFEKVGGVLCDGQEEEEEDGRRRRKRGLTSCEIHQPRPFGAIVQMRSST